MIRSFPFPEFQVIFATVLFSLEHMAAFLPTNNPYRGDKIFLWGYMDLVDRRIFTPLPLI